MDAMLRRSTDFPQRKVVAKASLPSEGDRKRFAVSFRKAIDRAVSLSGRTKQEFAALMGYDDASQLSRWISGAESVNVDRLWACEVIQPFLIVALAEQTNTAAVKVERNIRVELPA